MYMQTLGWLLGIHNLLLSYMNFFCRYIPATGLSSATCLTTVPLRLKKIFILCNQRHGWETLPARVCVSRKAVLLCVHSFCSASPHFSPLFSRGKSYERHHFKAHTATYAFPCQQSYLTHSSISLSLSLWTWIPTDFFSTTWSSWFCCVCVCCLSVIVYTS